MGMVTCSRKFDVLGYHRVRSYFCGARRTAKKLHTRHVRRLAEDIIEEQLQDLEPIDINKLVWTAPEFESIPGPKVQVPVGRGPLFSFLDHRKTA
jgi:hypothetical protein